MIVIITGANGFLGQHLSQFLSENDFKVIATGKGSSRQNNIDFNKIDYFTLDNILANEVDQLVSNIKPHWIIHNAAMSKPNECHLNREECLLQNVTATHNVVNAAQKTGAKLLFMSTDFVFGENGPNKEEDITAPLNFYGESKLMAEQIVKESGLHWIIIRPVLIYGKQLPGMPPSFLHWVKKSLENNTPIKVVNDQFRTPTAVTDICVGIYSAITKEVKGVFHLAGNEMLTPYQMALLLAEHFKLNQHLITPVTSETFPEPVIRAKKSGLINDKAKQILGFNPVSFEEGLRLL